MLWVRTSLRRSVLDTTLCDTLCQCASGGRWFSPSTPVSETNKTDRHDMTEIVLKVALKHHNRTLYWSLVVIVILYYILVCFSVYIFTCVVPPYCNFSFTTSFCIIPIVLFWWNDNINIYDIYINHPVSSISQKLQKGRTTENIVNNIIILIK